MTIGTKQSGNANIDVNIKTVTFELNTDAVLISYNDNAPLKTRSDFAQFKLVPGVYNFKLAKEGYESVTQTVDISKQDQKVVVSLKQGTSKEKFSPPALIVVESEPEGATVVLNGQQVGLTPYQGSHYSGEYTIAIQKELYYSQTSTFSLKTSETVKLPLYKLTPKYGIINLTSNPTGATARLDGVTLGKTPLKNVKIESGAHTLELQLATYQTISKEFSLVDGDNLSFNEELIPNFSAVTINCPSTKGVSLTLNGDNMGNLPYHNPKLMAGTYQVKLHKDLWVSLTEELLVLPNTTITKDFALTPNYGTIKITAPESDIYIDQVKVGQNYAELNKVPGNYQITARRNKHQDATSDIVLLSGQDENIILEPQPRLGSVSILTVDKFNNNKAVNNADLYLDNKLTESKTPAILSLLYGDYDLKITHPQFLTKQQKLNVTENQHREITILLETYSGSRQHKFDKHKKRAWISTGIASLIFAGAVTSNVVSNAYYDEYKNSISYAETLDYKDKTSQWRDIRDYSYYTASGVAIYSLYSWIRTAIYNN
ncbi:MAG: PEGA domain-containing protein [Candidatus Cloacimonadales bacterium]